MGIWDNVLDASIGIPLVGGWVELARGDDRPETGTSKFIKNELLEPGASKAARNLVRQLKGMA